MVDSFLQPHHQAGCDRKYMSNLGYFGGSETQFPYLGILGKNILFAIISVNNEDTRNG